MCIECFKQVAATPAGCAEMILQSFRRNFRCRKLPVDDDLKGNCVVGRVCGWRARKMNSWHVVC